MDPIILTAVPFTWDISTAKKVPRITQVKESATILAVLLRSGRVNITPKIKAANVRMNIAGKIRFMNLGEDKYLLKGLTYTETNKTTDIPKHAHPNP